MNVRLGIAGLRFGLSWARLFAACPDTDLVAVCDTDPQKLEGANAEFGSLACYADFDALLADRRVDAVGIFTPAPLHAAQSIGALRQDKHVLCAVPAALTMSEASQLVVAGAGQTRVYMMAENWLFEPSIVRACALYREGQLGQIYAAEAEYLHNVQALAFDASGQPTWRNRFPALHYPTHGTAPYLHMTGDRLEKVSALGASGRTEHAHGFATDWIQSALFRSVSGAIFRLTNSFRNVHAMSHFLSFHGDRGALETGRFREARTHCHYTLSENSKEQAIREVCHHPEPRWALGANQGGHGATSALIAADFLDAIEGKKAPAVDLFAALNMTLPGIAAVEALKTESWVDIPDPRQWSPL